MAVLGRTLIGFIVLFVCVVQLGKSEMFTAILDLERALHAEQDVAQELKAYVCKTEGDLAVLRKTAEEFDAHSREALVEPEKYVSNPLRAFLFIKRMVKSWATVENTLKDSISGSDFLKTIQNKTIDFPDQDDLDGAAMALHRLQDTYSLSTSDIARGQLPGVASSPSLSADDCFVLGKVAYRFDDFYHTILWMTEALSLLDAETEKTSDKATILDFLAYSLFMKGNVRQARDLTVKLLELGGGGERAKQNLQYYNNVIAETKDGTGDTEEIKNTKKAVEEETLAYERLCRGEPSESYKYKNKLSCRFRRHHPMFYLAPALEEVVHLNPDIHVYHRVMTDGEIQRAKDLAIPKLHRSGVFNTGGSKTTHRRYRISKSAWVEDKEDDLILRASIKTGVLANLTRDTVEPLQVLNYGIGGHYEPHLDFARKAEMSVFSAAIGNRIATTIFYMSDVEAGGCTVFPTVGVRICPEKGSMALWYNLLRNGEGDYNTEHAACPVLAGNKWVATKWYHVIGNEFTRQCGLNPSE